MSSDPGYKPPRPGHHLRRAASPISGGCEPDRARVAHPGRVHIEPLPGYAPELNPVEYVWGHSKGSDLANFCPEDIDELHTRAAGSLARRKTALPAAVLFQAGRTRFRRMTRSLARLRDQEGLTQKLLSLQNSKEFRSSTNLVSHSKGFRADASDTPTAQVPDAEPHSLENMGVNAAEVESLDGKRMIVGSAEVDGEVGRKGEKVEALLRQLGACSRSPPRRPCRHPFAARAQRRSFWKRRRWSSPVRQFGVHKEH